MKNWKRIILSLHTNYLHKWLVHFLTCLLLPCSFFFLWDTYIHRSRTTFYLLWRANPPGLTFYESGLACLPSWLGMVKGGWLGFMWSWIFLQMKFIIFQDCPIKQAPFLLWQPAPYNQLLIQPLLLVPECYFA